MYDWIHYQNKSSYQIKQIFWGNKSDVFKISERAAFSKSFANSFLFFASALTSLLVMFDIAVLLAFI